MDDMSVHDVDSRQSCCVLEALFLMATSKHYYFLRPSPYPNNEQLTVVERARDLLSNNYVTALNPVNFSAADRSARGRPRRRARAALQHAYSGRSSRPLNVHMVHSGYTLATAFHYVDDVRVHTSRVTTLVFIVLNDCPFHPTGVNSNSRCFHIYVFRSRMKLDAVCTYPS
ncbi:hypothetical protein EVAR_42673_1 [Eumeta japonica]|uniref:Uncharacterized protein n=1 Tax=Eumeta variegata TaxID=151549 RepID=A0A4C1WYP4_EUMVA|nr:hypothetical protein EVAR_42673_1 [Eumeta japonica]